RWRGQVVDLARAYLLDRGSQRRRFEQVSSHELYALAQVLGAAERIGGAAPHQAAHLIPPLQEQLGQEGPVLTGQAGDEGPGRLARSAGVGQPWQLTCWGRALRAARTPRPWPSRRPPGGPPHARA